MAADLSDILNRLAGLQEATTDAKTKGQLQSVIKQLRSSLQDQEMERNRLLTAVNQQAATIAELQAAAAARARSEVDQSPVADSASQAESTADAGAAGGSATPFDLATSFKDVIDAIQTEARQSSTGVASTIKSMDIEIKGLVQVEAGRGTVLVLPTISSPIDPNSLSTLRVSFGAIPVTAPATPAPTTVTVPDVRQKSLSDAITELQKASLAVGAITEQPTAVVTPGTVVSQQPGAGTVVAAQTPIALVVAAAPAKIVVPNLVGMTLTGATNAINAAGLQLGAVAGQQSTVAPDTVLQQSPAAGQQVAPGTAVNLIVATAPVRAVVPNVAGLTLSRATDLIKAAGLQVGVVDRQQSTSVPDTVLQQNPAAGQQVAPGSAVNLVVAKPPATVAVPNVLGLVLSRATDVLIAAGLQVGVVDKQTSTGPPDTVLQQNPSAGLQVAPGTSVNLVASKPLVVPVVIVPNVLGLTLPRATEVITALGLKVGPVDWQPFSPPDTVMDQSPSPGTEVTPGTAVVLTIGTGDGTVVVPDVVGLTLAKATKKMKAAGLTIGQVKKQPSSGAPGSVLQQSPSAGAKVSTASAVDVVVDER